MIIQSIFRLFKTLDIAMSNNTWNCFLNPQQLIIPDLRHFNVLRSSWLKILLDWIVWKEIITDALYACIVIIYEHDVSIFSTVLCFCHWCLILWPLIFLKHVDWAYFSKYQPIHHIHRSWCSPFIKWNCDGMSGWVGVLLMIVVHGEHFNAFINTMYSDEV